MIACDNIQMVTCGYRNMIVWQKSMDVVTNIYRITHSFPSVEVFGITSQMRRAAVSIPSNIAEGSSRISKKDFSRFMTIAYGSALELETQVEIASNLSYIREEDRRKLSVELLEIIKMLYVLTTKNS